MNSCRLVTTSGSTKRIRVWAGACSILVLSTSCESPTRPPAEPPPIPEPTFDQVGLPADYATKFQAFYVFDRPDNRQVRVVYANDTAAAGLPFKHGSVLVMETYRAKTDAAGLALGTDGRFQRDVMLGIFVMRKDKWFGRRYKEHQTGDWEYASFRPADKMPLVVGDAGAAGCAICHLDAGPARDWVYRANIHFDGASGAVPQVPAGHPVTEPFIDNYTFVPSTITIPDSTRVTWTNRDQVKHTLTANATSSAFLSQGAVVSRTFNTPGTFEFFCAIHPAMRMTVVVTP